MSCERSHQNPPQLVASMQEGYESTQFAQRQAGKPPELSYSLPFFTEWDRRGLFPAVIALSQLFQEREHKQPLQAALSTLGTLAGSACLLNAKIDEKVTQIFRDAREGLTPSKGDAASLSQKAAEVVATVLFMTTNDDWGGSSDDGGGSSKNSGGLSKDSGDSNNDSGDGREEKASSSDEFFHPKRAFEDVEHLDPEDEEVKRILRHFGIGSIPDLEYPNGWSEQEMNAVLALDRLARGGQSATYFGAGSELEGGDKTQEFDDSWLETPLPKREGPTVTEFLEALEKQRQWEIDHPDDRTTS